MKKNLKCLFVALLALGLTAPAFADDAVLVPSQQGGFKVGIDALYLRPTSAGLDYATLATDPTDFPIGFESNANATINPSYNFGVYAQVGYLFPCTGNDLTLGYTYLSGNSTDSIVAPPLTISGNVAIPNGVVFVLPLTAVSFSSALSFSSAQGKLEYTLNVVDLEAGQRFASGPYDMRMFAGLRYANIDSTLSTLAAPFTLPPGIFGLVNIFVSQNQEFNSQFRGIGPRVGVDTRYCFGSGFGVDVDVSTALLVGNVNSHYNGSLTSTITTPPTTSNFHAENSSRTRVIPVLEAKLGLDYAYTFCSNRSALIFEVGYQVTNYFNASDHHFNIVSPGPFNVGSILSSGGANDVAFDGPYLGVKYYA